MELSYLRLQDYNTYIHLTCEIEDDSLKYIIITYVYLFFYWKAERFEELLSRQDYVETFCVPCTLTYEKCFSNDFSAFSLFFQSRFHRISFQSNLKPQAF